MLAQDSVQLVCAQNESLHNCKCLSEDLMSKYYEKFAVFSIENAWCVYKKTLKETQ